MAVYLVTWNLNRERGNYAQARAAFVRHLEGAYQNTFDPGLESVRFISSTSSAIDIDAYLRRVLDDNDCLFVTKLRDGEHQGWIKQDTWAWINARIFL